MEGWIKLHRKLTEKAYYRKDSEAVHLWIHLLICANISQREETLGGKKIVCNPGQFTTGRKQLSESCGINESKIERLLNKFEKIEQQITQLKTTTNRLISILNWSQYQINEQQSEQQLNNDRTTNEQQLNTLQEVKKLRSKEVKEENDFLSKIIGSFQKSYLEVFGSEYILMAKGKERAAASKILQLYKTKYPDADSEKTISELTTFFKNCCMIDDNWIQKNMSLPIIVSKFNEINNKLKNGSKKNQRVTPESIERLTELATATQSRYGQ